MTLSDTIRFVEKVALLQPSVKQVVPNDIFRLNSMPNAEYAVFGWTQGQHQISTEESFATYNFTFFFIDRLTADKSNELEIQSVGIRVLDNIIRMLEDYGAIINSPYSFTTFNQRFLDECSGVFVQVGIRAPLDGICAEGFFDFSDDFNDDFATRGALGGLLDGQGFGSRPGGDGVVNPGSRPGGCDCSGYLRYHLCDSQEDYDNIPVKDPGTLYLIPEE